MSPEEILAEVRRWPAELRERWDERAAILEYDARLPRGHAEEVAWRMYRDLVPLRQAELAGLPHV